MNEYPVFKSTPMRRIGCFVALALGLSYGAQLFIIRGTPLPGGQLLLMWCPGAAALLTSVLFRRPPGELGLRPSRPRYLLASYLLPMAYAWLGYGLVWLLGLGDFSGQGLVREVGGALGLRAAPPAIVLLIAYGVTITLITLIGSFAALGEELGWRGLLVPELLPVAGFTKTALVSGLIWAACHYPLIMFGPYRAADTPVWYSLTCFTVLLVAMSFVMAWLRLRSGSVWTAVLFHAVHNAVIQEFLTPVTAPKAATPFFIDEFGAAMLPFAIALAVFFWRRARAEKVPCTAAVSPERAPVAQQI